MNDRYKAEKEFAAKSKRKGCLDLDPQWTGPDGIPRGPVLCVQYPSCECGEIDGYKAQSFKETK